MTLIFSLPKLAVYEEVVRQLLPLFAVLSIQILLHDPYEEPRMIERGLKVSPGFSTQIAVTAQYVSSRTG